MKEMIILIEIITNRNIPVMCFYTEKSDLNTIDKFLEEGGYRFGEGFYIDFPEEDLPLHRKGGN